MKIEKISENQIRCTLSHQDLADRELKISELAYGTDKAKSLFREMMQQASFQFGFEADDIPLMIEAIPISRETLILVITKVEDPDELDSRFSKFSPEASDDNDQTLYQEDEVSDFTDELLSRYDQLSDMINTDDDEDDDIEYTDDAVPEEGKPDINKSEFIPLSESLGYNRNEAKKTESTQANADIVKIYSFHTLDEISKLAAHISTSFNGENSVYKNTAASVYYLVMHKTDHTPEDFNHICNIASEYGMSERTIYATACHLNEHLEPIIKDKAIQVLAKI